MWNLSREQIILLGLECICRNRIGGGSTVLEQEGIDIDLIVGASAGALIGGAYASGQSPREIQAKIAAYLCSPEFDASTLKSVGLTFSPENKSFFKKARNFVMEISTGWTSAERSI